MYDKENMKILKAANIDKELEECSDFLSEILQSLFISGNTSYLCQILT